MLPGLIFVSELFISYNVSMMQRLHRFVLPILSVLAAGIVSWWVVQTQQGMVNSDFFTFWLGAKLAGQGMDVYDPAIWTAGHTMFGSTWLENRYYVYPLPLALIQIPLGWLPLNWAGISWVCLSILAIALCVVILRDSTYPVTSLALVLCGVFVNRSVLTTLRNGQMGAVLLFLYVLSIWLLTKRKEVPAGISLSLLLLKPTIGLPLVGLFAIFMLLRKQYKPIFSAVVATLILVGISLMVRPGWVEAFLVLGSAKGGVVSAYTPTWWGIAGSICQHSVPCSNWLGLGGSILISLVGIAVLVRYRNQWDLWQAGAFITCITLLVTPYLWAYDQILLLFPVVWMAMSIYKRGKRVVSILIPLVFAMLGFILLGIAIRTGVDDISVINTLVVVMGLLWMFRQEKGVYEN